MNGSITSSETETIIKNLSTNKSWGPDGFTGKFYQTLREKLTGAFLKLFQKTAEEGTLPSSFTITLIPKQTKVPQKRKITNQMNVGAKSLDKILAKWIQQHIKRIIQHDQVEFTPEIQRFFNICKSLWNIPTKWRIKTMWSFQQM